MELNPARRELRCEMKRFEGDLENSNEAEVESRSPEARIIRNHRDCRIEMSDRIESDNGLDESISTWL